MKIGVVFPQIEIGPDPGGVKAFAQAAEGLGYSHLLVYDHVLGASTRNRPDWSGAYSSESLFHEVFVLFGYLAGLTETLELVTGVLILPQRQTVLAAKQAAAVDVLSEGRLRLGVGVGWNDIEYAALNENFHDRGKRSEEQIEVMRALWTNEVVDFDGRWHSIPEAGLNPLPVQRPIPVWIGGYAPATMERIGRMGDGWFPRGMPGEQLEHDKALVAEAAQGAGRDPSEIGMEGRISLHQLPQAEWQSATDAWREAGATHMSIVTMGGDRDAQGHIDLIEEYKKTVE